MGESGGVGRRGNGGGFSPGEPGSAHGGTGGGRQLPPTFFNENSKNPCKQSLVREIIPAKP